MGNCIGDSFLFYYSKKYHNFSGFPPKIHQPNRLFNNFLAASAIASTSVEVMLGGASFLMSSIILSGIIVITTAGRVTCGRIAVIVGVPGGVVGCV